MREAPAKVALRERFAPQGLEIVGIDLGEDTGVVRKFARQFGITFPLLLDREGTSPRPFGVWGHPDTVLIDRKGRVVGLVRGERDWRSDAAIGVIRHLLDAR